MRNTKIICTLGPAVDNEDAVRELILSGLDAARFNFSHGDYEQHSERLNRFRKVESELDRKIPCILDTKGPEIRLGKFDTPVTLNPGDEFILTTEEVIGDSHRATISHKGLPKDVIVGTTILLDDGLVELEVKSISNTEIACTVKNQGTVSSNKGVNVPNTKTSLPSLTLYSPATPSLKSSFARVLGTSGIIRLTEMNAGWPSTKLYWVFSLRESSLLQAASMPAASKPKRICFFINENFKKYFAIPDKSYTFVFGLSHEGSPPQSIGY